MARARQVYRPRSIKRDRRTAARVEQLEEQILEVLHSDRPQSVRHLFYRMTDPRLPEPVEKSERGYRHVQHRVTQMRRTGLIRYNWITYATRRGYHTQVYGSAAEALRAWHRAYRADLWRDADCYVEVWVESRSIAGVIERTCRDLAVSLYPAGGFSSITLAYQAAEYITAETDQGDIPAHVLYIGDYDPAGVLIDRSLEHELRRHLDGAVDLSFERLAITEQQIGELDLPTKPRKLSDRRALHVAETVEAEAMAAGIMRELLRGAIEAYLPAGALEAAKAAEESERGLLLGLADDIDHDAA